MNEDDLRVQRTRRLLQEAFIQLLVDHGYEKLTVREIAQQAQVGYKTFYRHYESKERLLEAVLQTLIQDFQQTVSGLDTIAPLHNTKIALQFTQQNANLFIALTQSPSSEQLLNPLKAMALQKGSHFLTDLEIPDELAVYHFASSMHALMIWWIKHDMPYSIEEMADYMNRLILQPLQNLKQ